MLKLFQPRVCAGAVFVLAAVSGMLESASTQNRRDAILLFQPYPAAMEDSAFAVELGRELRQRLARWRSQSVNTVRLCLSTDACEKILDPLLTRRYGRDAGADFYLEGDLETANGTRLTTWRFHYTGRAGGLAHLVTSVSYSASVDVTPERFARAFLNEVWDRLSDARSVSRDARDCWRDLRDRQYRLARGRIQAALEKDPNHLSAAYCASRLYAELGEPRDRIIAVLEAATRGDSTVYQVWSDLAAEYILRGDTALSVRARVREVRSDPDDVLRLTRIAARVNQLGYPDSAIVLLQEHLVRHPEDTERRDLLTQFCIEIDRWSCALGSVAGVEQAGGPVQTDTTFLFQVIGLAQNAQDSSRVLEWTEEAAVRIASEVDAALQRAREAEDEADRLKRVERRLKFAYASALQAQGDIDSALIVYGEVFGRDSTALRAPLSMARLLLDDRITDVDTLGVNDLIRIHRAETLLQHVAAHPFADSLFRQSVAAVYLEGATRLTQARAIPEIAIGWFDRVVDLESDGELIERALGLKGLASYYAVQAVDARLRATPNCELLGREARLIEEGRLAAEAGRGAFPDVASNVLRGFDAYRELIPSHQESLGCGDFGIQGSQTTGVAETPS